MNSRINNSLAVYSIFIQKKATLLLKFHVRTGLRQHPQSQAEDALKQKKDALDCGFSGCRLGFCFGLL